MPVLESRDWRQRSSEAQFLRCLAPEAQTQVVEVELYRASAHVTLKRRRQPMAKGLPNPETWLTQA